MDKRIEKRHKRQVARARERVRVSEPDIRTPEQIKAAREASRPGGVHGIGQPLYATPSHKPAEPVEPPAADTTKADA